jgi:Na+-driven multidrug efflux pump
MAVYVKVRNEHSGEIKSVKVGFSWTLLFLSALLGIPLFLRRLYVWGGVMLALWIVNLVGPEMMPDDDAQLGLSMLMTLVFLGFGIFFGIKGNELTVKNYLEHGWEWSDPEDQDTAYAREKWALA